MFRNTFIALFGMAALATLAGCPAPVPPDPVVPTSAEVKSFTASATTVAPGAEVTLSWETAGAKSISLTTQSGEAVDVSSADVAKGSVVVKPTDHTLYVLTARGEVADRVEGLDAGATDYIVKPFAFDELAARVRAHLRTPAQTAPTRLEAAGIEMDLISREVSFDGHPVALSAKEFELLAHFLRHPNQVLSREQLLSAVWGFDYDPGTNIAEVYVGYVRRKLREAAGRPAPIDTLRAMGYRLTAR